VDEAWVFLVELRFKVHRGMKTEGAVEPLAVVKDFDPFKDGDPRDAYGQACGLEWRLLRPPLALARRTASSLKL